MIIDEIPIIIGTIWQLKIKYNHMKEYLMKKNTIKWWGILCFSMLITASFLSSCDDDDDDNGTIGIVPTVSAISPSENLKPGDMITITGTDFDQVKLVRFNKAYLLERTEFDASSNETQIILALPDDAPAGDLYLVSSEETVPNILAGTLDLVTPIITNVTPTIVEAGSLISVTGSDLDLVESVVIGSITLNDVTINEESTELTASCPDNIEGGILKLVTKNGTEVAYESPIELAEPIVLPEIVSVSDAYLGTELTITGTNMDLVTSVEFDDNITVNEFVSQTAYQLKVTVPASATTGTVTLKLVTADGEVVSPEFTIESVDPAQYVFYNFDDKGIGWNDLGGIVTNNDLSVDNTSFYEVDTTVDGGWKSYFSDNSAGRLNIEGVSVEGYSLRFDLNVLAVDAGIYLKFRLGDFWYAWSVGDTYSATGTDGWITVNVPLSEFKGDNGNGASMTTADLAGVYEWGLNAGWNGGYIHMRIDNVGFALTPQENE